MFSIHDQAYRLCDGVSRRELLRVGGLSCLGLSLPTLLAAPRAFAKPGPGEGLNSPMFGRAKNVIYLWLQGGPPQHETFDPKSLAAAEIRGEFRPISTNVPGIQFSELLPRTAAIADKLAVVRSLSTHSNLHDASAYWVLTGYKYVGRQSREIDRATDWPYLGSVIRRLAPSSNLPTYTSVWLPDVMRLNDNVQPAGQTAGFLGIGWDPQRVIGDPADPDFHVAGLSLPPEIAPLRLSARQQLLEQVERHFEAARRGADAREFDHLTQEALELVTSDRAREAFRLDREPDRVRDRYGRHKWGQCVLLARRLVEAGARLVHVNWPREEGDEAVNNPMWDTHAQNADRLQDVLCPQFDVTFPALIEDLDQHGLLSETLVVAIGEFGRTPRINRNGGRDHWGNVFSFVLAGAGISGAQVFGASDKDGAYPRDGRIEPQELTATILHLLGIGHQAVFHDATGRPHHATLGEPVWALLGEKPATEARTRPSGNVALVPPFTRDLLLNPGFEDLQALSPLDSPPRLKGWRARPLAPADARPDFGVRVARKDCGLPRSGLGHALLGAGLYGPARGSAGPEPRRAMLTQELRNPRAGTYTITLHASPFGTADDLEWFAKNFSCRFTFFGYSDLAKDPWKGFREYASVDVPLGPMERSSESYRPFTLTYRLRSQEERASEIELGVGIAVILDGNGAGGVAIDTGRQALIQVDDVDIAFVPRSRDDDVRV